MRVVFVGHIFFSRPAQIGRAKFSDRRSMFMNLTYASDTHMFYLDRVSLLSIYVIPVINGGNLILLFTLPVCVKIWRFRRSVDGFVTVVVTCQGSTASLMGTSQHCPIDQFRIKYVIMNRPYIS